MKEIVVRATIKTDQFSNTGFIHIKDNLIEGVFTFDYAKIILDGSKMILHYEEHNIIPDFYGIIDEFISSIYEKKYLYPYLEVPYTYTLRDETGCLLVLSIKDIIQKTDLISQILSDIETVRR